MTANVIMYVHQVVALPEKVIANAKILILLQNISGSFGKMNADTKKAFQTGNAILML